MESIPHKTVTIAFLLIIAFSGCKKDLLNIENPNTPTEDVFWQSEEDARRGVNSIYAMFYKPGLWARWMYFRLDLTSDEGFSRSPWVELADWTRFQYINYNFGEGNVFTWKDTYKSIFRCNQVLDNVPEIEFADEEEKNRILGQAKFLRAFHYYYAALLWENVPLVLHSSEPDDLPLQNTLTEVWAQVEQDLTEALELLPVTWDDANIGRPTKGAVNAYLARTYMQQHKWQEAKMALDYFFTGEGAGNYSLIANYEDNFTHLNENNSESVFEIQFSDEHKTPEDGDGPAQMMSSHRQQFLAPRSIGWSDGQARYWMVEVFKEENTTAGELDPRLRHTLFYPDLEADFGDRVYGRAWDWDADEAWFRKYARDYYRDNEDYYAQNNFRLVRYADILLMYAEVLNELGNTAEAVVYVDEVRNRVGLPQLMENHGAALASQEAFKERLKTERVLELCGESVRWADLKRWGDLDTEDAVAEVARRDPDFNNFEVGKHIRLPLPQVEVLNNQNLTQNPGY
ncbi:RagB/SusD family nutrient uptake outer membrane protein [Olivibacter sp. SDN3]|uniref:RagB/SusD family nutrient uptake outer membrane protein n=1 Tax=Olivibacter sp. SDN3 TaxID=2764720 RepID=UPI001651AF8E|nr:RagB/SusD family nutrient uptake outer membrane protein [Olivibacter sp. SDN3]QNL50544.1 RagB/SusD family nutrient uptake outer membrane protein [Olivibacter sp. SDN3]